MLSRAHQAAGSGFTVRWMNEEGETGLPYDLTVDHKGRIVSYIEVKSTTSDEKPFFEVTLAELDQARVTRSAYEIYRVFNAGSENTRIASLRDPVEHLSIGGGFSLLVAMR